MGGAHTCCTSQPGESRTPHARTPSRTQRAPESLTRSRWWTINHPQVKAISAVTRAGDALTVHALAVHALQGAGEQPQQQQQRRCIHLHIPLWPPGCFPPVGEKVVSSFPRSRRRRHRSCACLRLGERLASTGPNLPAAAATFPDSPSVVTGESGSAHAEANGSRTGVESGDPRRPEPNSGCLSRVSLVVTLEQKSKIHSTSCRSAGSSTTAGRSQVPAAPLLGPSGSGSGRYQTYIHIIPQPKSALSPGRTEGLRPRRRSDGSRAKKSGRSDAPERSRVKRSVRSEEPTGVTSPRSLPRGHPAASGRLPSE